jgi:hypothetical protein
LNLSASALCLAMVRKMLSGSSPSGSPSTGSIRGVSAGIGADSVLIEDRHATATAES